MIKNPVNGDETVFGASVGEHLVEFEREQATPAPPAIRVRIRRRHRAVNVAVAMRVHWSWTRTFVRWVRLGRLRRGARVRLSCDGRGCPWRLRVEKRGRLRALLRSIAGRTFRPGDRLWIVISEPGRASERVRVIFRSGAKPAMKRL